MTTDRLHTQLSASDYAAFIETAKLRALQIRREAIDQFWSALGRRLAMAWTALLSTPKRSRHAARRHASHPVGR